MKNKKCGVYMILCITTRKVYIGSSVNISKRMCQHFDLLRNNLHKNKSLQQDYCLYGKEAFTGNTLELCSKETLEDKESYWATYYNSIGEWGYNVKPISRNKEVKNKKKITPVIAINVDTGITTEYASAKECAATLGINYEGIWPMIRYWKEVDNIEENNRLAKGHLIIGKDIYDKTFDYISFRKLRTDGRQRGLRSDKGTHRIEHWRGKNPVSIADRKLGRKEIIVNNMITGKQVIYPSMVAASTALGLLYNKICDCIAGRKKRYKGYTFQYTGVCDRD